MGKKCDLKRKIEIIGEEFIKYNIFKKNKMILMRIFFLSIPLSCFYFSFYIVDLF